MVETKLSIEDQGGEQHDILRPLAWTHGFDQGDQPLIEHCANDSITTKKRERGFIKLILPLMFPCYNIPMPKVRLDVLLVGRGLAESRAQAQRLIMAGKVRSDGQVMLKPGSVIQEDVRLEVDRGPPFVSRGGEKLQAALAAFALDVSGWICADVGASTGGFTDCLLQHGARRVYAIDVGQGILHWKLRQDPRVVVMERTNARHVERLPEQVKPGDDRRLLYFTENPVAGSQGVGNGRASGGNLPDQASVRSRAHGSSARRGGNPRPGYPPPGATRYTGLSPNTSVIAWVA